jgi:hypothetical protein
MVAIYVRISSSHQPQPRVLAPADVVVSKKTHLRDESGRLLRHHVLQAVEHGFGRGRVLERVRLGCGGGPLGCGRFFQERAVDVVLGEVGSEGDERGWREVRAVRAEELTASDGAPAKE